MAAFCSRDFEGTLVFLPRHVNSPLLSLAAHAGDIRAALERQGVPIGAYDVLIAGHARGRGLTVITANLGEFTRVSGLRCENWID